MMPSNDRESEERALVALSLVPGVGSGRIRALVTHFGSAEHALHARHGSLAEVGGVGVQTAAGVVGFKDWSAVDDQIERARRCGARMVMFEDPDYPVLLREIYDPPAFLWVRGALTPSDAVLLAVVGTRRPTEYGKRVAAEMAAALSRCGIGVVSGLAYGIDAAAHRGALEAGGRTLAVLGSGVDRIYPGVHIRLAQSIMGSGAVVSEYPLDANPDAANFPRRNRVISGMCAGVLIVEAHEKGGALITARLAVEHNREVFAVPGPIHSPASAGCNRLIQAGHARLAQSVADILDEFGFLHEAATVSEDLTALELPGPERRLYDTLNTDPVHIDVLCRNLDIDPSTALVLLLNLEFKGLVRQLAGKQFSRI